MQVVSYEFDTSEINKPIKIPLKQMKVSTTT